MTKMVSHTATKNTVHCNLPAKALLNIALACGLLKPINAWWSAADYNKHAKKLIEAFIDNFKKFKVSSEIMIAGPEQI